MKNATELRRVEAKGLTWLVSSDGSVFAPPHTTSYSRVRDGVRQTFTADFQQRKLAPCRARHGYLEVSAKVAGRRVRMLLHRLVGMAYVPGYAPNLSINHIDGNKLNNAPENLEWVSLARNTQHQWETGLIDLRGENAPGHKLTSKRVVYIRRLLAQGISAHTLAVIAGVSQSTIALIRDGKRWPTVTSGQPIK